VKDPERRFLDDYTIAELHAIATRALANGDDTLVRSSANSSRKRSSTAWGRRRS